MRNSGNVRVRDRKERMGHTHPAHQHDSVKSRLGPADTRSRTPRPWTPSLRRPARAMRRRIPSPARSMLSRAPSRAGRDRPSHSGSRSSSCGSCPVHLQVPRWLATRHQHGQDDHHLPDVFFIQQSSKKDSVVLHLKLKELLASNKRASNHG